MEIKSLIYFRFYFFQLLLDWFLQFHKALFTISALLVSMWSIRLHRWRTHHWRRPQWKTVIRLENQIAFWKLLLAHFAFLCMCVIVFEFFIFCTFKDHRHQTRPIFKHKVKRILIVLKCLLILLSIAITTLLSLFKFIILSFQSSNFSLQFS